MMFSGVRLAKASLSDLVTSRAISSAEAESNRSWINVVSVSNGLYQSIRDAWTYVCRKRIASTQSTFRMPEKICGCVLNKCWIGPAMNSKPSFWLALIPYSSPGSRICRHWATARWAKGLRSRNAYANQLTRPERNLLVRPTFSTSRYI